MNAPTVIRITDPGELAASLPAILGFEPSHGDMVVVGLHNGRRVGATARVDLPAEHAPAAHWTYLGQSIRNAVRQDGAGTAIVIVYDTRVRAMLAGTALDRAGVDVRQLAYVDSGTAWCIGVPCDGHPLPSAPTPVAAESVRHGRVVAESRAALAARVAPSGVAPDLATSGLLVQLADTASRDRRLATLARLADDELLPLRETYAAAARVGTGEGRNGALVMVAVASWLSGDGAMANVALDAVVGTYPLASLLRQGLAVPLSPTDLRGLLLLAGAL